MNEIIVDTSVWIEFFEGKPFPLLEEALQEGRVLLSPVVVSELLSGVRGEAEERKLKDFLSEFDLVPCPFQHWINTGLLRGRLFKKGFHLSTPDAHLVQCALDCKGSLYSLDKIFQKIAKTVGLRLLGSEF